jgi:hypothetical protein
MVPEFLPYRAPVQFNFFEETIRLFKSPESPPSYNRTDDMGAQNRVYQSRPKLRIEEEEKEFFFWK